MTKSTRHIISASEDQEAYAVSFLDITVHPQSMAQLNVLIEQGIKQRKKWVIANQNLHSLYLCHRQPRLREFYQHAHWVHIDGMSLILLARLYGHNLRREQRVTYADWIYPCMELAATKGWRVFYLGSSKGVAETGAQKLRVLYPSLQIAVNDGYFDARLGSEENEAMLERINQIRPDILMVGMGMPRQEYWIQDNYDRLKTHVILPSGAAIDYVADALPTPPRWAGALYLEWGFRLMHEPRRLFGRYLIEPWYIVSLLALDCFRNIRRLRTINDPTTQRNTTSSKP